MYDGFGPGFATTRLPEVNGSVSEYMENGEKIHVDFFRFTKFDVFQYQFA